jgi:glutamine cyclotransferase
MKLFLFLSIIALTSLIGCNNNDANKDTDPTLMPTNSGIATPQQINFSILAQHPHDTSAYTQGLEIYNGKLYESTGDFENSSLRITDWKTGKVEKKHVMGTDKIFGEGITIFNNKIYQLTWVSKIVYVYDINNIEKAIQILHWPFEGWGITNNGKDLIISDGSANLYFVNPADLKINNTVKVIDNRGPVKSLNELEFINGFIYANVYGSDDIVKIDPESGHVIGRMTLSNLLQSNEIVHDRTDVLNGIAYDTASATMLITGKRWPKLFEVKLN